MSANAPDIGYRDPVAKQGTVFKRLETDAEYVKRIAAHYNITWEIDYKGDRLDRYGEAMGLQRKIIEDQR